MLKKILFFGQSDDSNEIYEISILVDSPDSTFWIDKGFQLHQVESEVVILKYLNTFMKCANMWRKVDKKLYIKLKGIFNVTIWEKN